MWFFVQLTDKVKLKYFGSKDKKEQEQDTDYFLEEMLAFFVVNFNYTKEEFKQLTRKEVLFIYKAWENKMVLESTLINNAFFNAYINANRKQGTKAIPLWKEPNKNIKSKEDMEKVYRKLVEIDKEDKEKSWYKKIIQAN